MLIDHAALRELDDVHELIDWSRVEKILSGIHTSKRGEKAWPPLLMFKALLLQSWYALSDPALEKQLARDLLFRCFIGLSITESVPDHLTLWRFRQLLEKKHLMRSLLTAINDQLTDLLNDFLEQSNAPHVIDYLSIDTEGSEFEILENFPFERWQIHLLTIEHNFTERRADMPVLLDKKGYKCNERLG